MSDDTFHTADVPGYEADFDDPIPGFGPARRAEPSFTPAVPAAAPAAEADYSQDYSEEAISHMLGLDRPGATEFSTTAEVADPSRGPARTVPITGPVSTPAQPVSLPAAAAALAGRPLMERFLTGLVMSNGSDLHMQTGTAPHYRIHGSLLPVSGEDVIGADEMERLLSSIVDEDQWLAFLDSSDLDFAYQMDKADGAALTGRFRANFFIESGQFGAAFRHIPSEIPTLEDLGAPALLRELSTLSQGLVLITGATGSGKSSTAAAFVDLINETRHDRIFTIEDPVEFRHTNKKAMVAHREVGRDVPSFAEALRRVRRQDPDVIVVGEMRDLDTIRAAIEAADTGHLVIATLHTNSAPETILRIVNAFPEGAQNQIRDTLAASLRAVFCQTLLPSINSPRGRVLASEVMVVDDAVAAMIRDNDIPAIRNSLHNTEKGSVSMDAALAELVRANRVTRRDAIRKESKHGALERLLAARTGPRIANH